MTVTVLACPECDSSDFRQRKRTRDVRGRTRRGRHDDRYTCDACGATFNEPVERPSKRPDGSGGLHGLAKELLDVEPDAVHPTSPENR